MNLKAAMLLFPLLTALTAVAAPGPVSQLERVPLFGNEYVRLDDWARANNFQVQWVTPKQELKLTRAGTTLEFTADSRKMSLNGVNVWLAAPIAVRNGSAHVAPVDLTTAIHPVLFPSKNAPGRAIKTICLDAGHGGKDPGNREGKNYEKKYTLLLAKEVGAQLTKAGFKVCLTRQSDNFVDLPLRPAIARERGADLFLSLHYNSADGPGAASVQGVETYCLTPARTSSTNARGEGAETGAYPGNRLDAKNALLAYQMQKSLVRTLALVDRGVRRARFAVLRTADMPAVMIEAGFMTHPGEAKKIHDTAHRGQMARAIVNGVLAYQRLVEQ